jgi:hypothetical protein
MLGYSSSTARTAAYKRALPTLPPYNLSAPMRFTTLVTIAAASLAALAKLVHPPQQVVLIYPETEVPVNYVFQIGWIYTLCDLYGLASNITTSFTDPRGNSTSITRWTQTCQGFSELEVYRTLSVPDAGLYAPRTPHGSRPAD